MQSALRRLFVSVATPSCLAHIYQRQSNLLDHHLELVISRKAGGAEPPRTSRTHPLSLEQSERKVAVFANEIAPDITTHLSAGEGRRV